MKISCHTTRKVGLAWMHGSPCAVEMRQCRRAWIMSPPRPATLGEIMEAALDCNPSAEHFMSNLKDDDAAYWDDAAPLQE